MEYLKCNSNEVKARPENHRYVTPGHLCRPCLRVSGGIKEGLKIPEEEKALNKLPGILGP